MKFFLTPCLKVEPYNIEFKIDILAFYESRLKKSAVSFEDSAIDSEYIITDEAEVFEPIMDFVIKVPKQASYVESTIASGK